MIKFTIYGNPNHQERHRSKVIKNKAGKHFAQNYDPTAKGKQTFKTLAYEHRPEKPFDCPVKLEVTFVFQRPKSHYRTGKYAGMLKDNAPYYHTKKPDYDNLMKFIGDSLNGLFWVDDSRIVCAKCVKVYTNALHPAPCTVVNVIPTSN